MRAPKRMSLEIAEASRQLGPDTPIDRPRPAIFTKATTPNVLVDCAKRVQRLQTKAARLRRELKTVEADLRHEKKTMRALVNEIARGKA